MPFIPATNVAEVVMLQSLSGQDVFNVVNFLYTGAMAVADLHIIATEVNNAWETFIKPNVSSGLTFLGCKVTDLTTPSSSSITQLLGTPSGGAVNVASCQNNVALVLSEGTDSRGRSFRGRLYAGGTPTSFLTDTSHVSVPYAAQFVDGWSGFFDAVEDATAAVHVIVSRYAALAARVTALITEVKQYSANTELDSMRSRLAGRGS